jgi:hypothetical protein
LSTIFNVLEFIYGCVKIEPLEKMNVLNHCVYHLAHRLTSDLNWCIFSGISKEERDANENPLNKTARKHQVTNILMINFCWVWSA